MNKELKKFFTVCSNVKNKLPEQLIENSVNLLNKKYKRIYDNCLFLFNMEHENTGDLNDVLEDFLKAKHQFVAKNKKQPEYFVIEETFKKRLECTLAYLAYSKKELEELDGLYIKNSIFDIKEIKFDEMFDIFKGE